jgi:hypothetical protein
MWNGAGIIQMEEKHKLSLLLRKPPEAWSSASEKPFITHITKYVV